MATSPSKPENVRAHEREMWEKLERIRDLEGRRAILVQKVLSYLRQESHTTEENYARAYRQLVELGLVQDAMKDLTYLYFNEIAQDEWGYPDGNLTPERLAKLLELNSE